jgi:hypothetical protein
MIITIGTEVRIQAARNGSSAALYNGTVGVVDGIHARGNGLLSIRTKAMVFRGIEAPKPYAQWLNIYPEDLVTV